MNRELASTTPQTPRNPSVGDASSLGVLRALANGARGQVLGALVRLAVIGGAFASLSACGEDEQPGECETIEAPQVEIDSWEIVGARIRVYFTVPNDVDFSCGQYYDVVVGANLWRNTDASEDDEGARRPKHDLCETTLHGSTRIDGPREEESGCCERRGACGDGCDGERTRQIFVDAELVEGYTPSSIYLMVLDQDGYMVYNTDPTEI